MDALFAQLDRRRIRLGMTKAALARRAKISLPTVQRLLSGSEKRARTDTVAAIAAALGVEVRLSGSSSHVHVCSEASAFRKEQARAKAKRLARLVQGTMALEADAVGADTLEEIEEKNVHALLAGSGRRLWSE